MVGAPYLILYVDMELMQVCGTPLMAFIRQFSLCLDEHHRLMINVDDYLLLENIIPTLAESLYNGVHFLVISGVLTDSI
jgi:hypothetical protein